MGKITNFITKSGKTYRQLEKETGINWTVFSRLKTGKQEDMKLQNAFKLADALNVDINEFREEDKEDKNERMEI